MTKIKCSCGHEIESSNPNEKRYQEESCKMAGCVNCDHFNGHVYYKDLLGFGKLGRVISIDVPEN